MTEKKQTHQQILEKALLKAHRNGWKPLNKDWKNVEVQQWQGGGMVGIALLYTEGAAAVHWVRELEGIIFNHDFAKALWGNGTILTTPSMFGKLTRVHMGLPVAKPEPSTKEALIVRGWHYHLQQMVIAEDPIAYLGENI